MAAYSAKDFILKANGTDVAQVQDFDISGAKSDEVDTTTTGTESNVQGIKRTGEAKLTVFWDPADPSHQSLIDYYASGESVAWIVNDATLGNMASGSGWVKELSTPFKRKDAYVINLTIRRTGTWLYSPDA